MSATDYSVTHDPIARRFSVEVEGQVSELIYRLAGSMMRITHTGVPEPVAGRGIGAALMRAALEAAREAGWRVVPACPYAEAFLTRHPEYRFLMEDR